MYKTIIFNALLICFATGHIHSTPNKTAFYGKFFLCCPYNSLSVSILTVLFCVLTDMPQQVHLFINGNRAITTDTITRYTNNTKIVYPTSELNDIINSYKKKILNKLLDLNYT